MKTLWTAAVVAALCTGFAATAHAQKPVQIKAVVVGANAAAPGRRALRYAHNDAREIERVLRAVGGVSEQDVQLLLDPDPERVLARLDQALGSLSDTSGETLLLFYYSGHADERALYPGGKPLPFDALRKRLDDPSVSVRLGIIDTCRGGGWTGSRGLSQAEVFEVNVPLDLASEGSVLIASSSGLEDAHESELLEGGFFTHHWNAALRGAADRNGDETVTLTEAFDYAKRLTIRDTAARTGAPQHPSFRMNLRGRRDLPLAQLPTQGSVLEVEQTRGPLQLVHLESGRIVLELPEGERALRLSVPPGRYVVRTGSGEHARAKEIRVVAGAPTQVREGELELVGEATLASRSFTPRPVNLSTIPDGMWELAFALGVRHGESSPGLSVGGDGFAALFRLNRGVTDRLQWAVPTVAAAYRFGQLGELEWIPWGGLTGWGIGFSSIEGTILQGSLGAGLDMRRWLSPRSVLQWSAGVGSQFRWNSKDGEEQLDDYAPTSWRGRLSFGYSHTVGDAVTLSLGAGYAQNLLLRGELARGSVERRGRLGIGSVQNVAFRPLPLIRVHLGNVVSLDGYAAVHYDFAHEIVEETYMLGMSLVW